MTHNPPLLKGLKIRIPFINGESSRILVGMFLSGESIVNVDAP